MNELFIKFLNMSITASYIVIAAVIIRMIFKKAPKWINYVLWGIVGIRLVLPFSFKSMFSVIPRTDAVPIEFFNGNTQTIAAASNAGAVDNLMTSGYTAAAGQSGIIDIITIVWIVGIAALMLYGLISYMKLRRRVSDSMNVESNIYRSRSIGSPFILGIIKPKIYLPYGVTKTSIPHIIAHEKAHISRKDHWIKPFSFALLTLYWFNPVIWLAYILLCRDIELACDERVIKQLGEKLKKPYSEALLACSMGRKIITACPLAFGEVGVKERIKNVLSYKKPTLWIIITAVILSVIFTMVFLTNPRDEKIVEFPVGIYGYAELIYITPVSSYRPFEDTFEIYDIADNVFTITDKVTGEITRKIEFKQPETVGYTNSEWKELFQNDFDTLDITAVGNKSMWSLSDKYQIYLMDGDVWLVNFTGGYIWSIYKLKPYEEPVNEADQEPVYDITVFDEPLDKVISHAIYSANKGSYSTGDISTQSFTILKKEDSQDKLVIYIMAMYMEFDIRNSVLYESSGGHHPVVITLQKADNGGYALDEYWMPEDGAGYMISLQKKFPDDFDMGLLDTQKYVKDHIQTCYESAIEQSGLNMNGRIAELIDVLCKSPAQMSNPFTYLKEHEAQYRELVYYGNYTLEYCFDIFKQGGQTGLEGYLMALVCSEILDIEPTEEGIGYATGQEWFDAYYALISGTWE